MSLSETKSPGWACCTYWLRHNSNNIIVLCSCFSCIAFISIIFMLAVVLFVLAIERIIVGVFSPTPGKSRWGTVGLGVIVLIVSIIVMAFPVGTALFLMFFLAVALFVDGISRIVHGIGNKSLSKGSRVFSIIAGVIVLGCRYSYWVPHGFGAVFLGILLAISLLINGIQIIVAGVTGRRIASIER